MIAQDLVMLIALGSVFGFCAAAGLIFVTYVFSELFLTFKKVAG